MAEWRQAQFPWKLIKTDGQVKSINKNPKKLLNYKVYLIF